MKPSIFYHSWNPFEDYQFDFDTSVSISVDTFEMDESANYKILILYVSEPTQTLPHIQIDQNVLNKFDKIYTHNQELLQNYEQTEFVPFGSCWLNLEELNLDKQNHISFVTSSKCFTGGHLFRQQIYNYFNKIDTINEFKIYQHKSPPFHPRRNDFFETSKFHIAVENCQEINWFSEKLIDCFVSKTIPIYCGCPNIGDFFNLNGMFIFNNLKELQSILSNLTLDDYEKMMPFVEENYELAKRYYGDNHITTRLIEKISSCVPVKEMEKNNCDIYILSHNSKEYTKNVYDSLSKQTKHVFVLENSYIMEEKFINENTIDFGEENIGIGGFLNYLIEKYSNKDDFFVGIFNNDITNISENLVKEASKFFTPNVGIISPSLNDPGCPYPSMFKQGNTFRKVDFVENVAIFINSKVLRVLKDSIPVHYWGWIDVITSKISNHLQLDNIILDNCSITHERSGVRKKMEDLDSNYTNYMNSADRDYVEWINKNPYLKEYL